MKLQNCDDVSDGLIWTCKRYVNKQRHQVKLSIRHGSWFNESNMRLTEILEVTYYWLRGERQVGASLSEVLM
jgi:nitric oxide reductase large subunit